MNKSPATDVQDRFERVLAGIRQPARLIGGEWGAGPGFDPQSDHLRVVLGFPDTYDIGISNQALQVLYHLAQSVQGVAVERTYLPWVDALGAMRREGVPLLTVETWAPVGSADVLGLTLQHEFNYTNVLELLDAAGIPVQARDRREEHPLVIAGGPACANFSPMTRFFDAVAVGDGEAIFPEILEVLREAKRTGAGREAARRRLSDIEGVYVPGVSRRVKRRTVGQLRGAPYPDACLVSLTAGIHDRAWIEIMRGCTRGCRFCQAGMWYRPVRERSPAEIMEMAAAQLRESGHQELAFASLSTTDYSCLAEVLRDTAAGLPDVRVSLPSLRVDGAAVRLAQLASPSGPSLTLAPEAGSDRMWKIINKDVTSDDALAAAEEAFRVGRTTLKLYFMIGLPLEEDADVVAIADLCLKIRETGRHILGPRANRLQLNVSVNNFIPKPFTPFQWAGMLDRETLLHRHDLLRSQLRKPGIKLTLHNVDKSYLEAVLARGGEETGAVIEAAWRKGARFDSWTEEFDSEAWREALAEVGTSAEELATATWPRAAEFPWEIVTGAVERDFLRTEWERAQRGEPTPDCRWDACSGCGACEDPPENDLADAVSLPVGDAPPGPPPGDLEPNGLVAGARVGGPADSVAATQSPAAAPPPEPVSRRWRYLATFTVTGRGRFIGHLDRTEIFRRAVRRAGGRLALSAGMRPKVQLSLAMPLAVGVEGLEELCEFELQHRISSDFEARLEASLPAQMTLVSLEEYLAPRPAASRVTGARYEVRTFVEAAGRSRGELDAILRKAAERFRKASELPIEETKEGRVRTVDVKAYVDGVSVEPADRAGIDGAAQPPGGYGYTVRFQAVVTPAGTARPEKVVAALAALAGIDLSIGAMTRCGLVLS